MTPTDAAAALETIRRALEAVPPAAPPITWGRLWELYLLDPPVAPNTVTHYGHMWHAHVGHHWGEREAALTTDADVSAYRFKRKNELTKRGKRITRPATRNREVMLLRTLATWGHGQGHLALNPLAGLDDAEPEDNVRETIVTEQQINAVLPWLPQVVTVYVILILDSGLRRSEAASLRWDQVDFDRQVIRLSRKQTKAKRSRYTMLSSRAALLLSNLPRWSGYVFGNPDSGGDHYRPNHFLVQWRRGCERANVTGPDGNVTLHDLRRTFATRTRQAGVPETEIMAMGGWTTAEVFTRYSVVDLGDVQLARKKLEAHLRRSTRRPPKKNASPDLTDSIRSLSVGVARTAE